MSGIVKGPREGGHLPFLDTRSRCVQGGEHFYRMLFCVLSCRMEYQTSPKLFDGSPFSLRLTAVIRSFKVTHTVLAVGSTPSLNSNRLSVDTKSAELVRPSLMSLINLIHHVVGDPGTNLWILFHRLKHQSAKGKAGLGRGFCGCNRLSLWILLQRFEAFRRIGSGADPRFDRNGSW